MPAHARRLRWASRLLACACGASLTAGCASSTGQNRAPAGNDPLLGGPPLQTRATTPTTASPSSTGIPPLPPYNSSGTTAALAANTPRTLDPNSDLRIGSNRGVMPAVAWQGQGTPGSVVLNQPELSNDTQPGRQIAAPAVRVVSLDQAKALLTARGVKWQKTETVPDTGECHIICSVPSKQNPNVNRTYDARAVDELTALQAVIDKIDQDMQNNTSNGQF